MRKNLKNIIVWGIILIFMGITLMGCGGQSRKNNIKIGISVYNQYDTFIGEMMEYVEDYVLRLEEKYDITITLDIQSAGGKQTTQNDQMDQFIDKGCDIVCINLVDRTDASAIIERAKSADIPVIFFNRELVEEDLERWDKLYYVGAEAFESGIIQGNILVEKLQEDRDAVDRNGDGVLQYVMLEGEAGHQDSIVRTMYSVRTVTEAGYDMEKLADEIANWNRDQARTKMDQWMQGFGRDIEVVFANNDDMALGALDALEEAGYYDADRNLTAPIVVGVDGTREALAAVEDGRMLGTVINDSRGQAEGMLELAYAIVMEEAFSSDFTLVDGKYIRLPYREYMKSGQKYM